MFPKNSSVIELHAKDFKYDTKTKKWSVVHKSFKGTKGMVGFFAKWCGHCVAMKPAYQGTSNLTGFSFPMAYVDADKEPALLKSLGIRGFPTIKIISNGVVSEDYSGNRDQTSMIKNICKMSTNYNFCKI